MISTGLGISILINAPYTAYGNWMTFGLCYSIRKYLPDAKLYLNRIKEKQIDARFFGWSNKLGIKNQKTMLNPIIMDCHSLMLRPIEIGNPLECSEAKEDKFTPFVSYKAGCGGFVYDEWINKEECPFPHADNFMEHGICINEVAILRLWKQINVLYPFLTRS
jgi:hypothetical protein